jgi:HEPN domain-containing protein
LMMERAKRWLSPVDGELRRGNYDNVLYLCEMCVETSLKAVLTFLGVDYPKEHDVSLVFRELASRADLPRWFSGSIDELSRTSRILAELRGDAAYGFERGLSPESFKEYTEEAVNRARLALRLCGKLVSGRPQA